MHRFAYASPIILTPILLAPMLVAFVGVSTASGQGFPTTSEGQLAFDVATALAYAAQAAWTWSGYEVASARAARKNSAVIRLLFLGLLLSQCGLLLWSVVAPTEAYLFLFGLHRNGLQTALALVYASALLVCAWSAASVLVAADVPGQRPYRRLDTFLLMIILPIGVWFLHRRVVALRAAQSALGAKRLPSEPRNT